MTCEIPKQYDLSSNLSLPFDPYTLEKESFQKYIAPENNVKVILLVGPSGVGKNMLYKQLMMRHNIGLCAYDITRSPRPGEQEGVDYCFIDKSQFHDTLTKDHYIWHHSTEFTSRGLSKESLERAFITTQ